ncbi:pantoate--beta-alanine ligase [Pedobacter glucosidilyticus]|uniref:pantoate--beta-alanine ligase n=1 Tax=Pedobacter glucosidilyticus TaxID=1122941 RepID=UPI000414FCE8|nr:pantoate--beta-alanine ligase [Pedobacter glucosidilyticus]
MKIITHQEDLTSLILQYKQEGKRIGLVPTMGALHQGHLSLIQESLFYTDVTVASIFVNPTQFNNKTDLLKYPKPIAEDIHKLEQAGCHVLFHPAVEEMYPAEDTSWDYKVGELDHILEGEFRPGHYKGVTQIVYKLFKAAIPDLAFFGQKDYQQFLVIKKMVSDFNLPIQLKNCAIVRDDDGLAMSSRNIHLSAEERLAALSLSKALMFIKDNYDFLSLDELKQQANKFFTGSGVLQLEYLRICNPDNLQDLQQKGPAIALIACMVGTTRLIDNMMLA